MMEMDHLNALRAQKPNSPPLIEFYKMYKPLKYSVSLECCSVMQRMRVSRVVPPGRGRVKVCWLSALVETQLVLDKEEQAMSGLVVSLLSVAGLSALLLS